jgi:hypothetical protein
MPRRDFDRRARIARMFCAMLGTQCSGPRWFAIVLRQVAAWDRREARDEAAQLGYLELGGEGG